MPAKSRPAGFATKAAVTAICSCILLSGSGPAMAFAARFTWKGIPACAEVSPAFAVSGAPNGTAMLRFVMHDENAPDFQHGGSTVAFPANGVVPKGAIRYVGPCPPGSERHRYVWTIEALSARGEVLATSKTEAIFPPQ